MTLSANTQAILLLTTHFSKANKGDAMPLTNKEWGTFALWLKDHTLTPESLLLGDPTVKLMGWSNNKITQERIASLLSRGSSLALAAERWLRAGLWIMTRSDPDYPKRLKARLKNESPPVIFGCGNRNLLNQGGIAVVGSRKANEVDKNFSQELGIKAAHFGCSIVSGGAQGIDEAAMLGALREDGTVIGILADSLLRCASSAKYRQYLMANNLALITPFNPEAGFNVGNAMQRNRYIYCLADTAIAVHSGKSGGTWNGVLENLQKSWVPMWVKHTDDPLAGNNQLIAKGARELSSEIISLDIHELVSDENNTVALEDIINTTTSIAETTKETEQTANIPFEKPIPPQLNDISFYDFFLQKVKPICREKPKTVTELELELNLKKVQFDSWLKQAVADAKLVKQDRPTRYSWKEHPEKQLFLQMP